jgi:hypothetical protein
MPEKANSFSSRQRVVVPGLLLLVFAALGAGRASSPSPAEETRSPSFTWGEVKPPAGRAGLSGVYHRFAVTTKLSTTGGRFITRAEHTYWCFFPDGRCYYSMPTEGLDNFNYDYVKGMNDLWCCTYRLAGDDGIITWGTGGSTVPFRRAGRTLLIKRDSDVYELLAPCDGLVLEGTFRREDWQDEISSKKGIRFSRDGTFVDEGFLGGAITMWWWAGRGLTEASFPPGNGRYRIARNSLVLLYDDGRKVRANFHLADPAAGDDVAGFLVSTRRFVKVE